MASRALYLKGHKVPIHPATGGFALAVYLDECQRALRPAAQAAADQMKAEYVEAFRNDIFVWLDNYCALTKGSFRPPPANPLWAHYWEEHDPTHTPDGAVIRTPYVRAWLIDHPTMHAVIGFELNLALFEEAGWLTTAKIHGRKRPLRHALAETSGLSSDEIQAITEGKHVAHTLLRQRTGPYTLHHERSVIHAGLIFVARYCPGPGMPELSWADAIDFLENGRTGTGILRKLCLPESYARGTEAIKAAKPYIEAFLKQS